MTELGQIVALNESSKSVVADARQVSLRAFDAMVRSARAGAELRGFAEVSSQMQQWSRELSEAVAALSGTTRELIALTSGQLRVARQAQLLAATARTPTSPIRAAAERVDRELQDLRGQVRATRAHLRRQLGQLEQLGLTAMVLSRAAAIEAVAGSRAQEGALANVAREFSERSERVAAAVSAMCRIEANP